MLKNTQRHRHLWKLFLLGCLSFSVFCSHGCKDEEAPEAIPEAAPEKKEEPPAPTPLPDAKELGASSGALEFLGLTIGRKFRLRPTPTEEPTWERMYGPDYLAILDIEIAENGHVFACSGTQGLLEAKWPMQKSLIPHRAHTPDPTKIKPIKENFSRCEHVVVSDSLVYASHRGDWFIPTSYVMAKEISGGTDRGLYIGKNVEGIAVRADFVYAAEHQDGVTILSQNETSLEKSGTITDLHNAWDVAITDEILVVADGIHGISLYDISSPEKPARLGAVLTGGSAQSMAVDTQRKLVFVATGSQGVAIVDISRPASPSVIHRIALSGTASHLSISNHLLSVAHWQGFTILDTSTPREPKRIFTHHINNERGASRTMTTAISSDLVIAGEWFGLHVFKVIPSFDSPVEMDSPPEPSRPDLVGQTAPNIMATTLDGAPWNSQDHKGKVIVLSYFGTFCPICLTQLADIETLIWSPLKGEKLEVIALGVNETEERVERFVSQAGITFSVAIPADGLEEGLVGRKGPGISQFPFDVVIGPDGIIAYQSTRYEPAALRKIVGSLLKVP